MSKTYKTKRDFKAKSGVEIKSGETVSVTFDVKAKDPIRGDVNPFHASYIRMTTPDGRVILTNDLRGAGIKIPSMRKLNHWAFDSIAKSVFGTNVEPDGWSYDGSPSWLLALHLI